GEGGMGIVYLAEQTRPVRRKVALKIIKPGMDTRQVIARFEAERQALALMDHPNRGKTQQRYVKFREVARKPPWHNGFSTLCPRKRLNVEPCCDDAFGRDPGRVAHNRNHRYLRYIEYDTS